MPRPALCMLLAFSLASTRAVVASAEHREAEAEAEGEDDSPVSSAPADEADGEDGSAGTGEALQSGTDATAPQTPAPRVTSSQTESPSNAGDGDGLEVIEVTEAEDESSVSSAPADEADGEDGSAGTGEALQSGTDAAAAETPAPRDTSSQTGSAGNAGDGDGLEVIEVTGRSLAGSGDWIGEEELERYEHDDVLKVLLAVPGVYIRQEDGYGLRPNIGMRGSGSERSAKITLMEDGVLFAPAPYSRPAAYYFPMTTKMIGIEILKGPSAVRYGPATVGGSVNMIQRPVPDELITSIDIGTGTDRYGKVHAFQGGSTPHFGWLIEGVKLRCDGFKILDNGGPTGFDKNDISARFRLNNSRSAGSKHELELELGYEDEVSHESYAGITTSDFAKTPYRRYAATQLDLLKWQRNDQRLTYRFSNDLLDVVVQLYRNSFHRDWDKLNRFNHTDIDYSIRVIMLDPKGSNLSFYEILTGQANSYSSTHQLMLGSNDRWFVSQGAQVKATAHGYWLGALHWLEAGARVHYDRAKLYHTEDPYVMRDGQMVRAVEEQEIVLDARDRSLAWAGYLHHEVKIGALHLNLGARGELVHTRHNETLWHTIPAGAKISSENHYFLLIPGAGVVYTPLRGLELLAGVHRGFVPPTPTGGEEIDPEESVNYETGVRFSTPWLTGEAIGFFSDFRNLVGACSSSSGCPPVLQGTEYNGGRVHSFGAEVQASTEIPVWGSVVVPMRVAYTYQKSTFQESFVSDNPEWGLVEKGYEVPYIPHHQVYFSTGLRAGLWGVEGYGHYTSKMRDISSMEKRLGAPTEATLVYNATASYTVEGWGQAYLLVENVLDKPYIVSRRPMGARSGVPRRFVLGYKNTFR